ncbi:MAG: Nramp family divalent metal transporter [Pseudomonadota bacterium]
MSDPSPTSTDSSSLRSALGPGLLMAAAAVGVSHLVQATRAGAEYGMALLLLLVLACALKYPFLEFGPRYAAATGENLINGYRRMGQWAFGIFLFVLCATMFITLASITLVTAGLTSLVFGLDQSIFLIACLVLGACIVIMAVGSYAGLDLLMKIIMALLALATLFAVALAIGKQPSLSPLMASLTQDDLISGATLAFVLAMLGWMPIPLDFAAVHSVYSQQRTHLTGQRPSVRHASMDFAIGYIGAVCLAVCFLLLGALTMYDTGTAFSNNAVMFAGQLTELYTQNLGDWAQPLIAFAALATMFSTALTVADCYPRIWRVTFAHLVNANIDEVAAAPPPPDRIRHISIMALVCAGSLLVIALFGRNFRPLIDFTTTVAFLAAPVIGWMNLKLLTGPHTPRHAHPGKALMVLAWAGMGFLVLLSASWLIWRISTWLG